MNLNEYKGSFLFKSSSSSSQPTNQPTNHHSKTGHVYIFVISYIQSFTSQIFGVVGSLGENLDFFSPLGFDAQTNSDHKTQKIELYSVRDLKRYLNEKNLIHGRVMATTSKFSPQIFESYFNFIRIRAYFHLGYNDYAIRMMNRKEIPTLLVK